MVLGEFIVNALAGEILTFVSIFVPLYLGGLFVFKA